MQALVNHKVVKSLPLPEHSSFLYEYLFGSNGVFIRASRPGLEVLMPIETYQQPIKGLATITPYLNLKAGKIPHHILRKIWVASYRAAPNEILFHLRDTVDGWQLTIPPQTQTPTSCQPISNVRNSSFADALVEIHSHHEMPAFFSETDNAEETGFRLYSVLGQVTTDPEIRTRVGLYGYHWDIPSNLIYEPTNLRN